ncbi:hypothetical protein [Pontiella sp.]|uniref:hypothetical protein n=1 Tax=Pontiella sp. TaxID=2837462 RepID=UPI0035687379
MTLLKRYAPYAVVMLLFAVLGTCLAGAAQHGGINHFNGFLAPLIGPWSRLLPPNAARFSYWDAGNYIFVISVTLAVIAALAAANGPKNKILRVFTRLLSYIAVIFWCLCGLGKVILELT